MTTGKNRTTVSTQATADQHRCCQYICIGCFVAADVRLFVLDPQWIQQLITHAQSITAFCLSAGRSSGLAGTERNRAVNNAHIDNTSFSIVPGLAQRKLTRILINAVYTIPFELQRRSERSCCFIPNAAPNLHSMASSVKWEQEIWGT